MSFRIESRYKLYVNQKKKILKVNQIITSDLIFFSEVLSLATTFTQWTCAYVSGTPSLDEYRSINYNLFYSKPQVCPVCILHIVK